MNNKKNKKRAQCRQSKRQQAKHQVFGSLSQAIEADAGLLKVLQRRPELAFRIRAAANQADVLDRIATDYHRETREGFANLLQLLVLMEVPMDPKTGTATKDSSGKFVSSCVDARGRLLVDRFMAWVRVNYLWPGLEAEVLQDASKDAASSRRLLRAIFLLRDALGENGIEETESTQSGTPGIEAQATKPITDFVM